MAWILGCADRDEIRKMIDLGYDIEDPKVAGFRQVNSETGKDEPFTDDFVAVYVDADILKVIKAL